MSKLTAQQIKNGKASAQSITQVISGGLKTTWMPTLCGYPIGKDGKPVQLDSRDEAITYAEEVKARKLNK